MNKVKTVSTKRKKAIRYHGWDPIKAFTEKQEIFKVFKVSCFLIKASIFFSPY